MCFLISEVPLYAIAYRRGLLIRVPLSSEFGTIKPDSGLGFHVNNLIFFEVVPSPLSSGSRRLIAASIYDEYSAGPSIRSICTRYHFTMTHVIQVCCNFC